MIEASQLIDDVEEADAEDDVADTVMDVMVEGTSVDETLIIDDTSDEDALIVENVDNDEVVIEEISADDVD